MAQLKPLLVQVAALWLAFAPATQARLFTVDDLLQVEDIGQVAASPGERWLVIEKLDPYVSAPSFEADAWQQLALSRLRLVDLNAPGAARPLLKRDVPGVTAGPFSPDGDSMVVYRFADRRRQAGIATLESGEVRWLNLSPELALYGRSVQWISDKEFVAIVMESGEPPRLTTGWSLAARLPQFWARSASGGAGDATVIGSGRFADIGPQPARRILVRVDGSSGRYEALAQGSFFDLEASPSGRFVALTSEGPAHSTAATSALRVTTPPRRRILTIVDLASGAVTRPCPDDDILTHLMSWSASGDELLAYGRSELGGRLLRINAASGVVRSLKQLKPEITTTREGIEIVRADWMGDDPVIYGRAPGAARPDWARVSAQGIVNLTSSLAHAPEMLVAIDRQGLLAVAAGDLWKIDRNGRAERLSRGGDATLARQSAFSAGDRLNAVAPRRNWGWALRGDQLVRFSFSGAIKVVGGPAPGRLRTPTAAGAVSWQVDDRGRQTVTLASGGGARPLLHANERFADVEFAKVRAIPHQGPNGEAVESWLYLPPGQSRHPWPLVVLPYPGAVYTEPPGLHAPGSANFVSNAQVLAARGYAVLAPSLPRDRSLSAPGRDLTKQILRVVEAAVSTGLIDPERVAVWGHSFGGYAALTAAGESDRFKSVIATAAPTNLLALWGALTPQARVMAGDAPRRVLSGWVEGGQANLQAPPWETAAEYLHNSPLFAADKVTTPILLIYGDQDFIPLSQGEQMFSALERQGKDAALLTLWGEGHVPQSPGNIKALYGKVFWWLETTMAILHPLAKSAP
jgi:dipeptidyl aminopeptidase/acylaminoacyl peptidase